MVRSVINEKVGDLPRPAPKTANNVMDLFSLKGKVASITGSSGGIGYAVAEAYAQAGADVAIWYNSKPSEDKAEYLSKTYGIKCQAYKCNVSDPENVGETIVQIEKDFGTIDIFVANAGVAWEEGACIDAEGWDKWRRVMDCDLNSIYYCAKPIGKIFEKKGTGSFIITASMSGHIVNVPQLQAPYNAAKAACLHLGKSLAVEWAHFARVNTVSPGYIITDISDFADRKVKERWWSLCPMGREGESKELVGAYLYLASDAASYTTGADIIVDGGYCVP